MKVGDKVADCGESPTIAEIAAMLPEVEMGRGEVTRFYLTVEPEPGIHFLPPEEDQLMVFTVPVPVRVVVREPASDSSWVSESHAVEPADVLPKAIVNPAAPRAAEEREDG